MVVSDVFAEVVVLVVVGCRWTNGLSCVWACVMALVCGCLPVSLGNSV